jgi:hypothetical protein
MTKVRLLELAVAAGIYWCCATASGAAQPMIPGTQPVSTAVEDIPVMSRPRPEYDPLGVRVGTFVLYPKMELSATYDDNVYRTQNALVDDTFITISPTFRLESQWSRHMLEVYGGLNDYQYTSQTSLDVADWNLGADGRYDVSGAASLFANGSIAEQHESLSSPNVVGFQKTPTRFYDGHAEFNASYQPNRLGFSAEGAFDRFYYLNTPLFGGGLQNNKDRNFNEYQASAKAYYDFSPGYSGFLRVAYDSRDFEQYLDRTGVHRSSIGYRVDGGVDLQISHLVDGELYVGYLTQKFTAPLRDVDGVDFSARLNWLATPLLTVHLNAARILTQVILAGASVSDDKSVGISADYELLRNVILQAHATYVDSTYPGITRHDESPDLGFGAKYFLNRNLSVDFKYDYSERATNLVGARFQDHQVMIGLNIYD